MAKLVISLREYQGHPFIDIRLHFLGDDETWHPSKRGITVSPSQWEEFVEAVGKVQAHLPGDDRPKRPAKRNGR